jgi:hypothetical protein
MESCQYRGYQIETHRERSTWCVSVYRTRSDLPILPRERTMRWPRPSRALTASSLTWILVHLAQRDSHDDFEVGAHVCL